MSRAHLYRAARPRRPLASALLLAAWLGGAILALVMLVADPGNGGAAAALDRLIPLVAMGAVATGALVIVAELAVRARMRAARIACAAVLVACGALAGFGAGALAGFGAGDRDNMLHAADDAPTGFLQADSTAGSHAGSLAWLVIGLLAGAGGLATAVAAARNPDARASV